MQFTPSANELTALHAMPADERLLYFLHRTLEAEEVWGLTNASGWVIREEDDTTYLPVWPYKSLAAACAEGDWQDLDPEAMSVEHFLHKVMPMLVEQDISLDIIPTESQQGVQITAAKLLEMYESLLEAGQYFIE